MRKPNTMAGKGPIRVLRNAMDREIPFDDTPSKLTGKPKDGKEWWPNVLNLRSSNDGDSTINQLVQDVAGRYKVPEQFLFANVMEEGLEREAYQNRDISMRRKIDPNSHNVSASYIFPTHQSKNAWAGPMVGLDWAETDIKRLQKSGKLQRMGDWSTLGFTNEKKEPTPSANFTKLRDVFELHAALLKEGKEEADNILGPDEKRNWFISMQRFNAGQTANRRLMQDYKRTGTFNKSHAAYKHTMRRFKAANELGFGGQLGDDPPTKNRRFIPAPNQPMAISSTYMKPIDPTVRKESSHQLKGIPDPTWAKQPLTAAKEGYKKLKEKYEPIMSAIPGSNPFPITDVVMGATVEPLSNLHDNAKLTAASGFKHNYLTGEDALTALPVVSGLSTGQKLITSAVKRVQNSQFPGVAKELLSQKKYKDLLGVTALAGAEKISPFLAATPGLKNMYKAAAYKFGSISGGSPYRPINSLMDLKKPKYGGYKGAADRDFLKQYIYGNQPGFEYTTEVPQGLERYSKKYGDFKVFKMNSQVGYGNAVDVPYDLNYRLYHEGKIGLEQWDNPLNVTDNIAGHMAWKETGADGFEELVSQDLWKFDHDDYLKKWVTRGKKSGEKLSPGEYSASKQIKLMERAGKPFVTMSRNPVAFRRPFKVTDADSLDDYDDYYDKGFDGLDDLVITGDLEAIKTAVKKKFILDGKIKKDRVTGKLKNVSKPAKTLDTKPRRPGGGRAYGGQL
jgi:hypothetical protein